MNFPVPLRDRWHDKRFNSFSRARREVFSARVYKIGLRLDFTCPNRDGTVAVGGCIYCNNASHTPQNYRPHASVTAQLEKGAVAPQKRHKRAKARNLRLCTHLILGFPGETRDDILATRDWSIDKIGMHNAVFKAFEARDTWQGRLFSRESGRFPKQEICASCEGVAT